LVEQAFFHKAPAVFLETFHTSVLNIENYGNMNLFAIAAIPGKEDGKGNSIVSSGKKPGLISIGLEE
jgi:hypothetical protein